MPRGSRHLEELSKLELDVMDTVWELGECTSADVITAYRRKRPLANTTVRTVLSNIRRKGYVEIVPSVERGYRIRPAIKREAVAERSLNQLVRSLFRGSPRLAILQLLKEERISSDDLREIQRMLEATERGGNQP
jgi:predicted transcriptional regulator